MVDFYDGQSLLIRTDRFPARRTASGDDVLNPGTIAILKLAKPAEANFHRVWLVKYCQTPRSIPQQKHFRLHPFSSNE